MFKLMSWPIRQAHAGRMSLSHMTDTWHPYSDRYNDNGNDSGSAGRRTTVHADLEDSLLHIVWTATHGTGLQGQGQRLWQWQWKWRGQ